MRRLALLLLIVGFLPSCTSDPVCCDIAPKFELEAELLALISDFEGDVGIYVEHLRNGQRIEINADTLFPTASMIKVPILLKTFDAIERGDLNYHESLVYRDSLLYPGEDLIGAFRDSAEVALAKVAMLMITTSDNTGSLWLQHLAGTGTEINDWLSDNGFEHTRVNSRTPGRRPNWEVYGWGQTTPREMADLVKMIRTGEAVTPAASEEMYRILTRIYWNKEALSQIPPTVQVASKQGAVSQSRSEVFLVNAPSGDYVVCVITKNQADTSWEPDNAGYVLLRDVSRTVWQHFEPDFDWAPAPGMQRYE
ncbi:MAG: hypothetical protein RhofKO_42820 [Rhodothermales bacterium]